MKIIVRIDGWERVADVPSETVYHALHKRSGYLEYTLPPEIPLCPPRRPPNADDKVPVYQTWHTGETIRGLCVFTNNPNSEPE